MDERGICEKVKLNVIFLRLRWKLEDFDQIAGWGLFRPIMFNQDP